uniref:Uncharacterized protein n=1 Tax=Opuntia streptacantha TaxID=393608 RepID=A0A7C9END7_OPUST
MLCIPFSTVPPFSGKPPPISLEKHDFARLDDQCLGSLLVWSLNKSQQRIFPQRFRLSNSTSSCNHDGMSKYGQTVMWKALQNGSLPNLKKPLAFNNAGLASISSKTGFQEQSN